VGGVVTALATTGTLTLGSVAALIGVLGIAARGVLVLIRHYQRLERTGTPFGAELVMRGTGDLLAPTLLSGLAAAAVLAPIVVVGSGPGFEILHPMAVTVLGGLATTMVLILFVLPVLYLRFGSVSGQDDGTASGRAVGPGRGQGRRPAVGPAAQSGPAAAGHPAPRLLCRVGGGRVYGRA
jgi:Cu/Ag efflux pump CusA